MGKPAELHPVGPHHHSNATVNRLLDRLERVEKHGTGGWRAKCPSHDGKSTNSLSISSTDDGLVLIHCFGGCEPLAIVHSVGLELSDLFEKRITIDITPQERRGLRQAARLAQWKAALPVLLFEALVVLTAARQVAQKNPLNERDDSRLAEAVERIQEAKGVLCDR